ncbi:acyltransferase [Labedella populi]|uniref:Acyltransferase n=1 Tax=Labedella populi TaxID=2498850 RepID=A0A3S4ED60_9MICO|nr:acyltransferase family protein [Labedella populi]RWZ68618.1 acyltransferase [Labedella populi]
MAERRSSAHERAGFRGDITGLRSLAVVPVVAFHAGVAALPGGFVGVDVFYVISGFLITTILVRELEATGSVRLAAFWTKRLRRLAPVLAVVVVVTLCASLVVLSPVRWTVVGLDGLAALLSVSNIVFASRATDYFADGLVPSPFLHTWSLGVEEQFYLLWPVLIVGVAWVARRVGARPRRALAVAFVALIVFSFALSVVWTPVEPAWSFYLLPTRAWEFAIAGLLALVPPARITRFLRSRRVADAVAALGVGLLVVSMLTIDSGAPFPGGIAALPVLATVLVIAGGTARSDGRVARALAARPLQWIGTVSYSWYLWHWPFIVLAAVAFPTRSDAGALAVGCVAGVASLGAAALSYRFIESPVRFQPTLVASPRRTVATVGAVTVAAIIAAGGVAGGGASVVALEPYRTYAAALADVPDQSCARERGSQRGPVVCELGDVGADRTVMLVGDSHAGHWKDALAEAAERAGVRLVVRWRSSCPAIPVALLDTHGSPDEECRRFQDDTVALVGEVRPDAVVLAQSAAYGSRLLAPDGRRLDAEDDRRAAWSSALDEFLGAVEATGARPGVVVDNPRLDFDPIECVARTAPLPGPGVEADSDRSCSAERSDALRGVELLNAVSKDVVRGRGSDSTFDVTDDICDEERCYATRDGVPVFRDGNHLSEVWTTSRAGELCDWLGALLR